MTRLKSFSAVAAIVIAFAINAGVAKAGLFFAISSTENPILSENPAGITLTNATSSFTVAVRRASFDSGGQHIAAFAFRLRSSDTNVAIISQVNLSGALSASSNIVESGGVAGLATGTYVAPQFAQWALPGTYLTLAQFQITKVGNGTATFTIEEATVGDRDFRFGPSSIVADNLLTGLDRLDGAFPGSGFSGNGATIGIAGASIGVTVNNVSAVPEPASCILVGGCLLAVGMRRRLSRLVRKSR